MTRVQKPKSECFTCMKEGGKGREKGRTVYRHLDCKNEGRRSAIDVYEHLQPLRNRYCELESDCLEFAKAVAKQVKRFFATETEMGKAIVNLRMNEFNPQALDNLTVTSLKSEAMSRTKATSRYPMVSLILATQCNQILLTIFGFINVTR